MKRVYNKREIRAGYLFVLPALIYMVGLIGYPLFYNIYISLRNLDVSTFKGNTSVFVGLENYRTLLEDPVFRQTIKQTFQFTIWCLVIQFSIGFLLAVLFSRQFPGQGPMRGAILISYMMPMSVTGLMFKNMFSSSAGEGVVNFLLDKLGLVSAAAPIGWLVDEKYALWAVIIANCWIGIPFNMLLLTSGLTNITGDIYESASIDGANGVQRFFRITVPLMRPAILSVLTLGFIYTFKVYDLVYMMTKGGPLNATQLMSTYSYKLSFTDNKFSLGAASAVILFLCLMVVGVFYLYLVRKEEAN